MAQARRGRPLTPLDPNASHAAKLGAVLRDHRTDAGLTLEQLAGRVRCSPQHISEVERAKTTPSLARIVALDRALEPTARSSACCRRSSKTASDADKTAPKPVEPQTDRRYPVMQRTAEQRETTRTCSRPTDAA